MNESLLHLKASFLLTSRLAQWFVMDTCGLKVCQTESDEHSVIIGNASVMLLDHIMIIVSVASVTSITTFVQCTQSVYISSLRGGGSWSLSVTNYCQFNHHFCTISVVEVLHKLENLKSQGLVNKITQSLLNYVTRLCVSHS